MLWVFAFYFDNYHCYQLPTIISLHYKELQLQCCRHQPLRLSQFAGNWN